MSTAAEARAALHALADPTRAEKSKRFFRTGPGEYGEGDVFIGVSMPDTRRVAKINRDLPLPGIASLLASDVHEERMLAVVILADRAARADETARAELADFYLGHMDRVNNWDLVDSSAPHVLGPFFLKRSRAPLHRLARSGSVWERRIAVLTTQHFIRKGEFDETLALARTLLRDEHNLVHKAVGWMLREIGDRDRGVLDEFLDAHASAMPRTMLRYAIEKLPEADRRRRLAAAG